jgi:outer membrane protein TolC
MKGLPLLPLLLVLAARPIGAQQVLTLREALTRADQHAFANRIARADFAIRTAERDRTLRGLVPALRAEASWSRTTDPLGAFGFQLRQRAVTQASFDPGLLNDPAAISNLGVGLVAEVPLVDPEAWLGRRAAASAARASDAARTWSRNQVQLQVVQAYFGGVLAREQVAALEAGIAAAQSHVRLAQSLVQQGMVTRSDLLLAEVKAGEIESQLLAARGTASLAIRRLALVLGVPEDSAFTLPELLADSARLMILGIARPPGPRGDVEAARLGAEAARRDVTRASSLLLPSINSFGRIDWNTLDSPFGGRSAWTVGVMARWSLFSGATELVERSRARAEAARAEAEADAAVAGARLEQDQRRIELEVARAALGIAERAIGQAGDAHRIITRKYEGGLATVTELLEAAALEMRARVERAAAAFRLLVAVGAWDVAMGYDLTELTILDVGGETP